MTKEICEIIASSWFYYKEICYDAARSRERKIKLCLFHGGRYVEKGSFVKGKSF